MARFLLPLLILFFAVSIPISAHAQQACDPTKSNACSSGQSCKSVNNGPYVCVADTCTPACKSGETCFLGQCRTFSGTGNPTAPNPSGTGNPTAPNPSVGSQGIVNPLNNIDSLPALLTVVLKAIVQIGTIILTLALVYVGFLFVVAQGNEEKISNAKSALLWTVIGGLILLGASAIGEVIKATVGTL